MRFRQLLVILLAVSVMAGVVAAQAENKSTLTAKTTSIAAFKNGLGFFVREGEAKLSDGWATYDGVPPAALGTFWVGSNKPGVSIERLVASEEEIVKTVPATSISEMLSGNVGTDVVLQVGDRTIKGKLVAAPDDRKPAGDQPAIRGYGSVPQPQPSIVIIESSFDGTVAVNKNEIKWVGFTPKAATSNFDSKEKVKRLRFKVNGAKDKAPVTIGYLQKGVSWSPAYLVELIDDAKARITMQGLLINDVEDIDGAEVTFIVGYPNFVMADTLSPLSLTQSLSDFVAALSRPTSANAYGYTGNAMSQSVTFYDESRLPAAGQFGYSAGKDTPGAPEEDLFLYRMKDVSLKKGERAYYTVFSAETSYKHIYEWSIPDTSNVQPSGYVDSNRRDNTMPAQEQIWHKLKLTNASGYPWTTAPAMVTSGNQPLSQDSINYTPKGANSELKVTVATDLKGTRTEVEKSRQTTEILNRSYFNVTADGNLKIKSFKGKPVTVTVKKTVIGEVTSAGQGGSAVKTTEGFRAVNPTSIITWEVPLQPGEEKSLDYTYHTYISY
jgi:hypothetical protein